MINTQNRDYPIRLSKESEITKIHKAWSNAEKFTLSWVGYLYSDSRQLVSTSPQVGHVQGFWPRIEAYFICGNLWESLLTCNIIMLYTWEWESMVWFNGSPLISAKETCWFNSSETSPDKPLCAKTACCKFKPSVVNAPLKSWPSTETGCRVMYAWKETRWLALFQKNV